MTYGCSGSDAGAKAFPECKRPRNSSSIFCVEMDKFVTRSKVGQPNSSSTHPSVASSIAPEIQRDIKYIVDAYAKETIKAIIEDLDGNFFGILVDESKDISHKEQMTLVLRYVNKEGEIIERFVVIIHLTFVALEKKHSDIKRRDSLRQHQAEKLEELLISGEVHTRRGLNQEHGLQRPGGNHWGSHYRTLGNLIVLFSSIIHILEFVAREGPNYADRLVAESLMTKITEFEFDFMLHLMWKVLMITNDLSSSLQRMDQDIVNAMELLTHTKQRLKMMRNSEFESLRDDVSSFCELNTRFDAVSTDLLLGMASLNPLNSFGNFDKNRIIKSAGYYPNKFDSNKLRDLSCQFDSFIVYDRGPDKRFFNLKGISDLSKVLVKSDLHQTWPLVYLLIKLTLILSVATASVERAFSSMNYIKNELHNSIDDEFLNSYLVCYIECKIFSTVNNDDIIHHFQHMKSRRSQ
ncbi:uncharacterized protein LOC107791008 [Nicotiana tabacum]|uniref:Uncharacterized protein LOC107791008 n=1 Tax=Nicotiana tabacum TaxID=4097 RepID=A0AC58T5A0_TOBAC